MHLKTASYNVQKCVGLDLKRDPGRVIDVINELEADVVAIQEADKRLGARPAALPASMIETHSDFRPIRLPDTGPSLGWHGNAILLREDAEVIETLRLDLPGLEPRGALLSEIRIKGQVLRIVATHLGLIRRHRRAQIAAILDAVASRKTLPTLIMGDFNEWKELGSLEGLNLDYTLHTPGRSFHAARPVAALDRIAASGEFELEDAGVHQQGKALSASDHLPIWGQFRLTSPVASC